MQQRPPIITILGHVDHGKTSLLDAIRHTNVTASETGGITQHIGAYQVDFQGSLLTFIDTPGHAAFSAMRSRGGQIADIAVLVIAADDGVKPQTQESIEVIKSSNIPFVVAITKSDLPEANPIKVKTDLTQEAVLVEGFGGNTPVVEVSAKTGANLDLLLETLILLGQLQDLNADPDATLEAIVVESSLDRHKGPVATLIVKNGTLKLGDSLASIPTSTDPVIYSAKVRALTNWQGTSQPQATPSTPIQVLGFASPPPVGAIITTLGAQASFKPNTLTPASISGEPKSVTSLRLIIKADVVGTLEAIISSLPADQTEILLAQTGPVTESDVLLADTTKAFILAFRVPVSTSAQKLSQIDHVTIYSYGTIYELLEAIPILLAASVKEHEYELELAQIKVLKIFNLNNQVIVGSTVLSGSLSLDDQIRITRGEQVIGEAKVASLRIGREAKDKVKKGEEFGLVLDTPIPAQAGDLILGYKIMTK